jgi:hypothetical protein
MPQSSVDLQPATCSHPSGEYLVDQVGVVAVGGYEGIAYLALLAVCWGQAAGHDAYATFRDRFLTMVVVLDALRGRP